MTTSRKRVSGIHVGVDVGKFTSVIVIGKLKKLLRAFALRLIGSVATRFPVWLLRQPGDTSWILSVLPMIGGFRLSSPNPRQSDNMPAPHSSWPRPIRSMQRSLPSMGLSFNHGSVFKKARTYAFSRTYWVVGAS
jgi:hypothetical protein